MTYGNLPYPDLPTLPVFLSENPYQRRNFQPPPQPELPLEPQQIRRQHAQPSTSEAEDDEREEVYDNDKLNPRRPLLRISNLLFSYDDPERTAFFVPLMILLVVHALFLFYLHVYAPSTEQTPHEEKSAFLEYSLNARRYYDVDGLRNKVQCENFT